jgi:SAM-dependent methyltransferase
MTNDDPESVYQRLKARARPLARRIGLAAPEGAWWELKRNPWDAPKTFRADPAVCNICHWSGPAFSGPFHTEMADCPLCGSIARDRFLLHCFLSRVPYRRGLRVLETSPRMGAGYREMMRRHFDYTASDFDQSAHIGDIRLDLQDIALPSASVDVLLTPHVLEHVPDTRRAIKEIHRILSGQGRMYLQVPLCYGTTHVPTTPEFHADNTPVFFNFGWDLAALVESEGFTVSALVTEEWFDMLNGSAPLAQSNGDGFHVEELFSNRRTSILVSAASGEQARKYGFMPGYQFVTFECVKN